MLYYNKIKNIRSDILKYYVQQYLVLFKYVDYLINVIPKYIVAIRINKLDLEIVTTPKHLISLMLFLKNNSNSQYKVLTDIMGYDVPRRHGRFCVVYSLLSVHYNTRLAILVQADAVSTMIPSVNFIHSGSAWLEREVFDLFGIFFYGHKDLRRILTDYGFEGHPLRKDFPLTGFVEIFYDDIKKRIVYEPVSLAQEYRNFNFKNPWH